MRTSKSHFRRIEVIEADEVCIKSMDENEASISNEADAEEGNEQIQQVVDDSEEDISEKHMGQFLQDGIFGPRTSKIWSSSRTAADYKIDLPNIFLASLICISTMFLRKIDD